jgi:hypothetical protein
MKSGRAAWAVWARSLLLLLIVIAKSGSANAQSPQEMALARTLFQEGVTLADRSDWVGASDRFGRAYSLKPTSGIAFNWARALAETGKVLHARELLMQVERDEQADPQLRRESSALLAALEPRVARIRITTDREPSADVVITVDDQNWPRAAWGIASPIDPGEHTVVCREGDVERTRADVTLAPGEQRDVLLRLSATDAQNAEARSDGRPDDSGAARKPLYKSWLLWSAVGVVAVGGVVAAVLVAKSGNASEPTPVMGNTTPGVLRW